MGRSSITVGVLSDTHGLVRPEATQALRGSDLIVHAGDVGSPEVLDRLREIAPTRAVRGNVDRGAWAESLPQSDVVEVEGAQLFLIHAMQELELDPAAAGFAAVICGHSHQPSAERRGGVLYLNPGSAGPRRFRLPVAVARIHLSRGRLRHELVELAV